MSPDPSNLTDAETAWLNEHAVILRIQSCAVLLSRIGCDYQMNQRPNDLAYMVQLRAMLAENMEQWAALVHPPAVVVPMPRQEGANA